MRCSVAAISLLLGVVACGGDGGDDRPDGGAEPVVDASAPDALAQAPTVRLPKNALGPDEIAVIVNTDDPQSVAVGDYYRQQRGIPVDNVIEVSFAVASNLPAADFEAIHAAVEAAVGPEIQAYALAWTLPYRVDCMSITSAFALGFDTQYCNTSGMACGQTAPVDYYGSTSVQPFTDFGMRPAMLLAAASEEEAYALIDRGIAADGTAPTGDGYFVRTTDSARSVRWPDFVQTVDEMQQASGVEMTYVDNSAGGGLDYIEGTTDVLFYFTGLANVPAVDTNGYVPGALADHLTSFGGRIPSGGQMSVVDWLAAGVTASYGTVVEPCNYRQKFPNTNIVVPSYYRGATAIEAYWKSVHWPGEGVFVGEPLARPWSEAFVSFDAGTLTIRTTMLVPGRSYELRAAQDEAGPYEPVLTDISIAYDALTTITLPGADAPYYELAETAP